jgi:hypothetical protein
VSLTDPVFLSLCQPFEMWPMFHQSAAHVIFALRRCLRGNLTSPCPADIPWHALHWIQRSQQRQVHCATLIKKQDDKRGIQADRHCQNHQISALEGTEIRPCSEIESTDGSGNTLCVMLASVLTVVKLPQERLSLALFVVRQFWCPLISRETLLQCETSQRQCI